MSRFFLLLALLIAPAAAQTPAASVTSAAGDTLLRLNTDGGFVVGGLHGTGTIPAAGAGSRMMWYPAKYAFRAGRAMNAQWDDANVGFGSAAFGLNTTAGGVAAFAAGDNTEALGYHSVAMGAGTKATGKYSVALGNSTEATTDYATAIGRATTASGGVSTAMGSYTLAAGNYSVAMGVSSVASGEGTIAMGGNTTANGVYAWASGFNTVASGSMSMAMGIGTNAQAYASVIIGRYNTIPIVGTYNPTSWIATEPLFVAGNGTTAGSRSNALTLLKNGNLSISGTLTQSSDARLKEDIAPLEHALSDVLRLRPVRYRFREGTNRPAERQVGLVAQEVQEVLPELVREEADGYLSVSYANLAAVAVAAIREQQVEITALRVEVAALRNELAALRDARTDATGAGAGGMTDPTIRGLWDSIGEDRYHVLVQEGQLEIYNFRSNAGDGSAGCFEYLRMPVVYRSADAYGVVDVRGDTFMLTLARTGDDLLTREAPSGPETPMRRSTLRVEDFAPRCR